MMRVSPVRFGSVAAWVWNGPNGSGCRFGRVPLRRGLFLGGRFGYFLFLFCSGAGQREQVARGGSVRTKPRGRWGRSCPRMGWRGGRGGRGVWRGVGGGGKFLFFFSGPTFPLSFCTLVQLYQTNTVLVPVPEERNSSAGLPATSGKSHSWTNASLRGNF